MATILKLTPIESIKAGPKSTIMQDGTILNPVPYEAADLECDDGFTFQVERPLTLEKIKAAKDAAEDAARVTIDGISTGDDI